MPDRPFDDLAGHAAPPPSPGLADAVIAAGRRRVRRGRAAAGAVIGTVVLTLAVPLAVQVARTDSAAPPLTSAAAPLDRIPAPAATAGGAVATVDVTAAVIGHVASTSGPDVQGVDVGDAFCADADRPAAWSCAGASPITPAMQRAILDRLGVRPPIRFVATPQRGPQGSSGPGGTVLFLTLGPVRITGRTAEQFVRSWCGFDCLRGERYELAWRSGGWLVIGSFGAYVS